MTTLSEEQVFKEISKFEVLSNIFHSCDESIRKVFVELVKESSLYSDNINGYAKQMKETHLRLAKHYTRGRRIQNYCMYTLEPKIKNIVIDVRTDGTPIESEELKLINRGNCFNGGFEWHQFNINDSKQLPEVLRLIKYCYEI